MVKLTDTFIKKQKRDYKNKLIELYTSKVFTNNKDNNNSNDVDLDFDLSTFNSKLVDEFIDTCSSILNSTESEAVVCRSNLSTPHRSEKS